MPGVHRDDTPIQYCIISPAIKITYSFCNQCYASWKLCETL